MPGVFKWRRFILFLICAVCFNIASFANAEAATKARAADTAAKGDSDLRTAFVKVADKVGPAVVSISTERVNRAPASPRRFYFGPGDKNPFGDDFFDDFFKDFFGDVPQREYKQTGLGSGVIIDADGFILTNEHVIGGAEKITVTLSDGRSFQAAVKGTDPRSDLAIIKIDAKNLPYAELGDSDLVKTGEWVVAIGNPFGFAVNNPKPTVTIGVISAVHRSLPGMFGQKGAERSYLDLIQTDAAINPGNSGGPLCDLEGNIIGINAAIVSTTGGYQGVGFAIPSNVASSVIGDLINGKRIEYGWFGVTVQEVTEDIAKFFGLREKQGVLVASVLKDAPAKKAGIREGDIILKIDDEAITTVKDVLRTIGRKKPGETARVTALRDKARIIIAVVVGSRPGEAKEAPAGEAKPELNEDIAWRGMMVADITTDIAARYSITDAGGVIISVIQPGSPASDAGLSSGDIIREINRTPVRNKAEFNKAVSGITGDTLVRTDKGYAIVKEPANK